ncbi:MAG: hypothetical protein U0L45_00060 [Alistipes sp.]|nr:hypothetical protein [Alistipes sp.]
MKNITKFEMIQQRGNIAQLNIVGLAPTAVKSLLKLHNRIEIAIAEYMRTEQQLIDKYGIKIVDNGRFDHTSENFAEFTDTLRLFREEEVDLSDLTPLTEDEAIIAVSKIDAPIGVIATIKDLLN